MSRIKTSVALVGALASAVTVLSVAARADGSKEKCYGVALKGQNDCAAGPGTTCAGTNTIDFNGASWKLVPNGSCTAMQTPFGPGSLAPLKRPG